MSETVQSEALLERLNASSRNTLMEALDIQYSAVGEGYLVARMPVNERVHQPMGILHGGASAVLAESVGSAASFLLIDSKTHYAVGLELSINHIRSMRQGVLSARADIVHQGRSTHLWDIRLEDQDNRLIATSRLMMMILAK